MSDQDLIAGYDNAAANTSEGLNYWRAELLHRRQMRAAQAQWEQANDVRRLTVELRDMTKSMKQIALGALLMSGIAVVVSLVTLLRA